MPWARDETKLAAIDLFVNICLDGYIVHEVYPFLAKNKPYCMWWVKFTRIANTRQSAEKSVSRFNQV